MLEAAFYALYLILSLLDSMRILESRSSSYIGVECVESKPLNYATHHLIFLNQLTWRQCTKRTFAEFDVRHWSCKQNKENTRLLIDCIKYTPAHA